MLETLKGVKEIDGFAVIDMDTIRTTHPDLFDASGAMNWETFERDVRPYCYIYARHSKNSLSFKLQDGPIKERGVNGCQVDTLIAAAHKMISGLDDKFSRENAMVQIKLQEAMFWLKERKRDREARGVEGTSNA